MVDATMTHAQDAPERADGWQGVTSDLSSDQRAFKTASWGKAMMWIFLLSDTFIFSCFLLSYMTVRMSTVVPWPNPSEVFALHIGGTTFPLLLIAIMTFVLISSSGTMALAVNYGYRRDRKTTAILLLVMRTKVMMAIRMRGTSVPPICRPNTLLGLGQGTVVDIRVVM